jgi:hypothetical protein
LATNNKERRTKKKVSASTPASIRRRKQLRILASFGTVDFDPQYDYKAERSRKRQ